MPLYDFRCDACATEFEHFSTVAARNSVRCKGCGGSVERLYKPSAVVSDSIPGGLVVDHVLTNPDGSPAKVYSKSELKRRMAQMGYENHVEHKPEKGSDKSKHTSRWF